MAMLITSFVCVAAISISLGLSHTTTSDDYVPCDRKWYYFRNKCYRVGGNKQPERLSWTKALARCKQYGADLASIHSQEEQDFIVAFLQLRAKWWAWIGLNDRDEEEDFKWTDGSDFNYSNWYTKEPSLKNSTKDKNCIVLLLTPLDEEVGQWKNISCDVQHAYICKKNPNLRGKSPNAMYCSPEEGGGWKYQTSCYHVVTEEKSWQDAERHCKFNYNGHLLTIRDSLEDYFLELAIPDIKKEMWLGIKIQNQLQQKWTSSWYVSYDRFNREERYLEGTCAARRKRTEWISVPCSKQLPFICEVSEARPPVLKPPQAGAHCPKEFDEWRDLGGDYCYYIETTKDVDFSQARFECSRRGGELVSLHSQEEADILQPFILYKKYWVYIGLIRLLEPYDETFAWLDGSLLDYQKWGHNQPDKENRKCVHAFYRDMKWYSNSCEPKNYGYICSVKKIVPKSSISENSSCKKFCVAAYSYLYGLLSECPDAKEIS